MNLCTIGLGYIGLPTSIMFAKYGANVVGVDVNEAAVNSLNNGSIHIEEPGLQEALDEVMKEGNFVASLTPKKSEVFIIAVPTPNNNDEHKSCDLSYVKQAVNSILPYLEKNNTVIIESTIAPRSIDDEIKPLIESIGFVVGEDVYLVHCPERVLPGQIMNELIYNNRIIGGVTEQCTLEGKKVYERFVKGELILTDARTAEMSKLMENTYRDVNIALANELTKICNELNINTLDVIEMANKHPRVNLHSPGPGVGGHCLAVDPYFIISSAPEQAKLISNSREINLSMPQFVIDNIFKLLDYDLSKKITIFGATYKGNVDDTRESPALEIYEKLRDHYKATVTIYDPHVKGTLFIEEDLQKAVDQSSLVVVLTDHPEFNNLNYDELQFMKNSVIFDTKNMVKDYPKGFNYYNFGNLHEIKEALTV